MAPEESLSSSADKTVLIIDDDEDFLKFMVHVLKKEGFKTDSAEDGAIGLKKIGTQPPDLIILDLNLPSQGGFEILRKLQGEEAGRIPIIVVTARNADRSTVDMIRQESNVIDFMQKPIKLEALVMAVHRTLKTKPPEI